MIKAQTVAKQDKQPKGIIPLQYLKVETSNNIFQLYSVLGNVIKACRRDSDKKLVKGVCFWVCAFVGVCICGRGTIYIRYTLIYLEFFKIICF